MSVPTLPTESRAEPLDSAELEINAPLVRSILVGFLRKEVRRVGYEKAGSGVSRGVGPALVPAPGAEALRPHNARRTSTPYPRRTPPRPARTQPTSHRF